MFYIYSFAFGIITFICNLVYEYIDSIINIPRNISIICAILFIIVFTSTYVYVTYDCRPESKLLYIIGRLIPIILFALSTRIKFN